MTLKYLLGEIFTSVFRDLLFNNHVVVIVSPNFDKVLERYAVPEFGLKRSEKSYKH